MVPRRILDWVALIDRLGPQDREGLRDHFRALGEDDRRLRFGASVSDSHIDAYVDGIDFAASNVYGVRSRAAGWIGIGHLSHHNGVAELGLSVMPEGRGRGLGAAIFRSAVAQASRLGASRLYMHCLTSNRAILSIARSAGMSIGSSGGEADAYLLVPDHADLVAQLIASPAGEGTGSSAGEGAGTADEARTAKTAGARIEDRAGARTGDRAGARAADRTGAPGVHA
jgi:GNAT superfamily N-acetyltransferase